MQFVKIRYGCSTCQKAVRKKHFTAEDGRILCYECRKKEKAKPADKESFRSALGIKKSK